ncbi:MAG: KTSC domain-containing protein [Burkholderiales bacterium]|nr:KTSC domain-containing protein [Burkholderiales bacterium]
MDMKNINAGKLRAIGYDQRERLLRVELEGGVAIEYAGVSQDVWKRLSGAASGAAWSYYRDHIEEEFVGKRGAARASTQAQTNRAALEDLFKTSDAKGN